MAGEPSDHVASLLGLEILRTFSLATEQSDAAFTQQGPWSTGRSVQVLRWRGGAFLALGEPAILRGDPRGTPVRLMQAHWLPFSWGPPNHHIRTQPCVERGPRHGPPGKPVGKTSVQVASDGPCPPTPETASTPGCRPAAPPGPLAALSPDSSLVWTGSASFRRSLGQPRGLRSRTGSGSLWAPSRRGLTLSQRKLSPGWPL